MGMQIFWQKLFKRIWSRLRRDHFNEAAIMPMGMKTRLENVKLFGRMQIIGVVKDAILNHCMSL
jgi:hypothetical protein